MSDSSDNDYELPSLSDRVQALSKPKNISEVYMTSDSESDEKEFVKFSEKIRNTPYSAVKQRDAERVDSSEVLERLSIPRLQSLMISSDSESDESDFLKFSERVWNTPRPDIRDNLSKDKKDNAYKWSRMNAHSISTHKPQKIKKSSSTENKENCREASESESDDSFFTPRKFPKTPKSVIKDNLGKNNACKDNIRNAPPISARKPQEIKKLLIKNKENLGEASDSDSDDSFFTPRKLPKTPKSVISVKKMSSSPSIGKEHSALPRESRETHTLTNSSCLSATQMENEKEFKALFPPSTVNSSFLKDRVLCSRKLYDFFNRKIFNSELPGDMRLEWDGSLLVTAGLTCCSRRNEIYSCYIRLSSQLLTSFERMRDTLLHEMCHAAVWLISHRNDHHGPLWKIWASRCKLILPCIDVPDRCHTYDIAYRVWYQCPSCKQKIGRCKQSRRLQNAVCKKCKVPFIVTRNK